MLTREPINLFNVRRLNAALAPRDIPEAQLNPVPAVNVSTYGVNEHTSQWSRDLFWRRYMRAARVEHIDVYA